MTPSLDLACVALVLLAAVGGAFLGALAQAGQLAGVVAGWVGARLLGPRVATALQGTVPAFAAGPLGSILAFIGCTIVIGLVLRALLGIAARKARGGAPDRGLGALLGGAQAALVLWVGLSALAAWGRPVHFGPLRLEPKGSQLVAFAREYSAFALRPGAKR
jgi:uncharacterized membrane protein required for colicin V production